MQDFSLEPLNGNLPTTGEGLLENEAAADSGAERRDIFPINLFAQLDPAMPEAVTTPRRFTQANKYCFFFFFPESGLNLFPSFSKSYE